VGGSGPVVGCSPLFKADTHNPRYLAACIFCVSKEPDPLLSPLLDLLDRGLRTFNFKAHIHRLGTVN